MTKERVAACGCFVERWMHNAVKKLVESGNWRSKLHVLHAVDRPSWQYLRLVAVVKLRVLTDQGLGHCRFNRESGTKVTRDRYVV